MSDIAIKSEYQPPKGALVNLRTLWSYMRGYKRQLILAASFLCIGSAAVLVIPSALQGVVDTGFAADGDGAALERYIILFAGLAAVMAVATALRFYYVTWIGERVVADIRQAVYERLITLSPVYFEDNRPGEIVSRLTADTTLVQTIVGSSISIWLRNFLVAVGGTIWLFIMSPRLMLLIALVLPVILVLIVSIGRWLRSLSRTSQDRVADVGAKASESLSALAIIQAFTREAEEARRFSAQVEGAFSAARRRIQVRAAFTFVVISLIFGAFSGVIYFGAQNVLNGTMTSGTMVEFFLRAVFVAAAFGALSEIYSDLQRAAGAAGRLAELLRAESAIQPPARPASMPVPARGALALEHVSFCYPSRPQQAALRDVSLAVAPGETVALVGPSGAGKSTILQLLLRFYDPTQGRLILDDVNLRDVAPDDFRKLIALVPQETVIFADTVAENIRYGRLEATTEDIREAARAAAALEFIEALPEGFDSPLGERGARLSGGQRQRIAIARAILRDAPILLLDEATSSLDAESEQQVQAALSRLMADRTTLVIAHRLATVKQADRIVVLDEGRIVAEGTHAELMAADGLYRRLANLQFGET